MARVTKEMTMGELLQTYYEQCPEIVDAVSYTHLDVYKRQEFHRYRESICQYV